MMPLPRWGSVGTGAVSTARGATARSPILGNLHAPRHRLRSPLHSSFGLFTSGALPAFRPPRTLGALHVRSYAGRSSVPVSIIEHAKGGSTEFSVDHSSGAVTRKPVASAAHGGKEADGAPAWTDGLLRPKEAVLRLLGPFLLPAGYPNSVDSSYSSFYAWEFVKSVVSSASYMISTQAMLSCIGLYSAPTAGAINWVLKDGLGCVGVIFVARGLGKRFDKETKRLRWGADVLHVLGVGVELCTMLAPSLFLPMASVANTAKGMAGITNGATRASINKSLALKDNLGDLTAKAHAQGLLGYLSGMGIGVALFSVIEGTFAPMLVSYLAFTGIHLFASYKALQSVSLPSLNKQRLCLVLDRYFSEGIVADKNDVPAEEHIIFPPRYRGRRIVLGSSLHEAGLDSAPTELEAALALFAGEEYLLSYKQGEVSVVLKRDVSQEGLLKAFFNAYYLNHILQAPRSDHGGSPSWDVVEESHQYTTSNFEDFRGRMSSKGWDDHVLLMTNDTRATWGS